MRIQNKNYLENLFNNILNIFHRSEIHIRKPDPQHCLTQEEVRGLKHIVMYLFRRPAELRAVPDILPHPEKLIAGVREIIKQHKDDCPEAAITGSKTNIDVNQLISSCSTRCRPLPNQLADFALLP